MQSIFKCKKKYFQYGVYPETEVDWEKLKITPFQIRGEWMDLTNQG